MRAVETVEAVDLIYHLDTSAEAVEKDDTDGQSVSQYLQQIYTHIWSNFESRRLELPARAYLEIYEPARAHAYPQRALTTSSLHVPTPQPPQHIMRIDSTPLASLACLPLHVLCYSS